MSQALVAIGSVLYCRAHCLEHQRPDRSQTMPGLQDAGKNQEQTFCRARYQHLVASGHNGSPLRTSLSPLTDGPSPANAARTLGALSSARGLTQASILSQPHKALVNEWEGVLSASDLSASCCNLSMQQKQPFQRPAHLQPHFCQDK